MASMFILLVLSVFLTAESTSPIKKGCDDPNEVYKVKTHDCQKYCRSLGTKRDGVGVCAPTSGCFCKPGYRRNEIGKCIKECDCYPPKCVKCNKPNEWWDSCTWTGAKAPCPKQDCSRLYSKFDCSKVNWPCVPTCRCKGDLVRINGECVPIGACSCKKNEVYKENTNDCQKYCKTLGTKSDGVSACAPTSGCFCRPGYRRNENDECIKDSECPGEPPKCGPNMSYSDCGSSCPDSCANFYDLDRECSDDCVEGCFCDDGYVLNRRKECVTPDKCGVNQNCGKNEIGYDCLPCPPRTCDSRRAGKCGPQPCRPGCDCKPGYLRNATGICIPDTQCDDNPRKECGINEEWDDCGTMCERTCKTKDDIIRCQAVCKSGCFCLPEYVRDDSGRCVLKDHCVERTNCSRKNHEVYNKCGSACPPTCSSFNTDRPCTRQCVRGCFCEEGYVRDEDGRCVKPEDCKPRVYCNAKKHEIFLKCGSACPDDCSNYGQGVGCGAGCVEGCFCQEGYLRNPAGDCVEPKQCPGSENCNENEIWVKCAQECPPQDCASIYTTYSCDPPPPCKPGCNCLNGYLRDYTGKCVPTDQCFNAPDTGCGGDKNAISGCGNHCGNSCDDYKKKNKACPLFCKLGGCDCKKGFVYDPITKKCVLPEDCTPVLKCGRNEVIAPCASPCRDESCKNKDKPIKPCPIRIRCPNPKCVCKENYCRNEKKQCVPYSKPNTCPAGEIYQECGPSPDCVKTCANRGAVGNCNQTCTKGCFCPDKYYRNDKGKCVLYKDCTCNGDPNTTPGCGTHCGNTCNDHGYNPDRKCGIGCSLLGCNCKEGYVYDRIIKRCVKPEHCTCPKNETHTSCYFPCPSQKCEDADKVYHCPLKNNTNCRQGCVCLKGYYRNTKGNCVLRKDCVPDLRCGRNEVIAACATPCHDDSCKNMYKPYKSCPIRIRCPNPKCVCKKNYCRNEKNQCVPAPCKETEVYKQNTTDCQKYCKTLGAKSDGIGTCAPTSACFCRPGYRRNENEECIKNSECPNKNCGKNEIGYDCLPCPGRTCNSRRAGKCADGRPCIPGCDCKHGYLRNATGICIPDTQCDDNPRKKCGINEEWDDCGTMCERTCKTKDDIIRCQAVCKSGCFCLPEYVRDDFGRCVLKDHCVERTNCSRKNHEVYNKCGSACPPTCSDLNTDNSPCTKQCVRGCFCEEGYVRDEDGRCVKPEDCKPRVYCYPGKHEIFLKCGSACPDDCSNYGQGVGCGAGCVEGCFCQEGYLRNPDGDCVEPRQCPPDTGCGGDENAVSGCGNHCGHTCDDYNKKNIGCPLFCKLGGCDCKKGFVYDPRTEKCVLPEDCSKPKTCPAGEIYQECGPSPDCVKTCANRGAVGNCNQTCTKGCFCPDKYYRNDKGKCVLYKDCTCNGDPNTTPGCGTHCGNTCNDHGYNPDRKCGIGCSLLGCNCKEGYVYDRIIKRCVKPEHCTCPKNETHTSCYFPCPSQKCEDADKIYDCSSQNKTNCRQGCVCLKGYCRTTQGNCVLRKDCVKCGVNEIYVNCAFTCPTDKCPVDDGPVPVCDAPRPEFCKPGCRCQSGYKIHPKTKKCVKASDCPPYKCTGKNQEYQSCPPPCRNQGCAVRYAFLPRCRLIGCGNPGCYCKSGFFRNDEGDCVSSEDCPGNEDVTTENPPTDSEPPVEVTTTGPCLVDDDDEEGYEE